nr:DNA-directed RNA polymerase II subunit RPB1-like protein [Ipomoea batatas]
MSSKHEVVKPDHARQAINLKHITEGQKGHSWVVIKKETSPPMLPNSNLSADTSRSKFVNDFQSTTPGNSPSIGHSAANKTNTEAKARTVNSRTVEGNLDDLKAREPGHSPARKMAAASRRSSAVVHAGEEKKARRPVAAAKGSPRRRYMEGAVDSFRPTAPGHSPGIGHSIHD